MQYFISRNGQQEGPYSVEEIRSKLASGELTLNDHGWQEKMPDWQILGSIPAFSVPGTFAPRTPPPAPSYEGSGRVSRGRKKTSGMAIASMVSGICTYVLCASIVTGIPAIILGHLALGRIKQSRGGLSGKGMAIAGLVMGYLSVLLIPIMLALALPAVNQAVTKAKQTQSLANIRQISVSCIKYAQTHGGSFPASLEELELPNPAILRSPLSTGTEEKNYVYVPGLNSSTPAGTIFLYDSHVVGGRYLVGRVDGSCEMIRIEDFEREMNQPSP
jgi:hypothetical protein